MKKTLSTAQIAAHLYSDKDAGWSWKGAYALAVRLEEIEEIEGREMEFDIVAINCDFSEYESLQEWARNHFGCADYAKKEGWKSGAQLNKQIKAYINDHGQLIEFDGGIIVSTF